MLLLVLNLILQAGPIHCGTPVFDAVKSKAPTKVAVSSPADGPGVGDSRTMWLQNMSVMPPVQYQTSVTCRGVGNHCYVMVEDSSWNAGQMDSTDVARIIERFDHTSPRDSTRGVWDLNTTVLGRPPDAIDSDSLIYLIYQDIGTFHGIGFDGFWQYFDEYYDTTSMRLWGYHSNEVECVYLDCWPQDPSGDYRIAIAAHEFGHMIQWNYDQAESLWVNEGCAELAMWLFGSPDNISDFNTNSDNDLTNWSGSWADYIKTYLWFLYLYEQYGGRVGTDLVHNIIASPEVSIAGIDSGFARTGLPQRFDGVFDDWALANIIADTSAFDGRYGYYGDNVPRFTYSGYHGTYPVNRSTSLRRWAGEYVLFQHGRDLDLSFDGADGANFHLFVVGRDTMTHTFLLDTVPLDSVQRGSAQVPGSDSQWQFVYLVPVSHDPYGTQTYAYTASAVGIEEEFAPSVAPRRPAGATIVRNGLGPFAPGVLYDASGRHVSGVPQPGIYWLTDAGSVSKILVVR